MPLFLILDETPYLCRRKCTKNQSNEPLISIGMFHKKTKIVATISEKHSDVDFLKAMYEAGMNVVRLNTAHQALDTAINVVENVRKVSDKIALLIDTKGPEMRITPMESGAGFTVAVGDLLVVSGNPEKLSSESMVYVNYAGFVRDVPIGATVLIDDGEIALLVTDKTTDYLVCEVRDPGRIEGRKSINVPGVPIKLPALSDRDRQFIHWAIDNDLDFIAHSFVRSKEDVIAVQQILDERHSHLKIIAKIENQQGVDNIDEILAHVYGIMVARGDLGVEIAAEKIPVIQRMLIAKCQAQKKPVIIATQMLHSMIEHSRPTRAEVSDVANSIYRRTDAIMLSGETAYGAYPLEAVRTMAKIAGEIEAQLEPVTDLQLTHVTEEVTGVLSRMIVESSRMLPIKAIVLDTLTGRTGRYVSAFRPHVPVFAKCYKPHVMRELALSYGVYSYMMEPRQSKDDFVKIALTSLISEQCFDAKDMVGVVAGSFGPTAGATFMEIGEAGLLTSIDKKMDAIK
jgi:pyruvate kinase